MEKNTKHIDKQMFEFAQLNEKLSDKKLDTKALSYFHDALNRFKRNKASIVASIIIIFIILFAIFAPMLTEYNVSYNDSYLGFVLPKSRLSEKLGWDFWDGCSEKQLTQVEFDKYLSMGVETNHNAIKNNEYTSYTKTRENPAYKTNKKVPEFITTVYYRFRLDSYHKPGVVFKDFSEEEYITLQKYQDETGIQVIYPITDRNQRPGYLESYNGPHPSFVSYFNDGNYWYKTKTSGTNIIAEKDSNGNFINIYLPYSETDGVPNDNYTSRLRVEGEGVYNYLYATKVQTGYSVRINYYEYYKFYHKVIAKDGITEPLFLFGTTRSGQDIFTCLGSGARLSFIIAIVVSLVNLIVGAIYGAIEGYYGGTIDLIMERFSDILSGVPFMIVITLLKYHMGGSSQLIILFIAFFLTGWIGMASRVRMQFYRYKNQEYVLAARTLGAKDLRLMFKHIFPNSLGTLITGSVLVIPGFIFSESNLSYLGIINLNSGSMTSVGTLLANAQPYLQTYPHMIVFPAIFISLLMLTFNLFGNGLRDAFNPSLRGSED